MQTVLIIDDSSTIRYLVKVYLSGLKLHLVEAADGSEGLALVNRGGISLVLADLRMPGMDGFEFIRQVRAQPAQCRLPVILLTSESKPGLREEALRTGASEFMTKPVTLTHLRDCVQRWLTPE